jgi:hypothetical protein
LPIDIKKVFDAIKTHENIIELPDIKKIDKECFLFKSIKKAKSSQKVIILNQGGLLMKRISKSYTVKGKTISESQKKDCDLAYDLINSKISFQLVTMNDF